jgi:hypothetical protein
MGLDFQDDRFTTGFFILSAWMSEFLLWVSCHGDNDQAHVGAAF